MQKKNILRAVAGASTLILVVLSSTTTVGSGESVRVQNTLTGGHTWYTSEGLRFKAPLFSTVAAYPQEVTVVITDNENVCNSASICAPPRTVVFSDTYEIAMEVSYRYSLPKSAEQLEIMHDKVKTPSNLFATTLLPFSQDLINYTAAQFRGEEYMQGGQNSFKSRLTDQAANGLLQTKREKVPVEAETADRDSDRSAGATNVGQQFTYVVSVLQDPSTGSALRTPTAIEAYGITIVPSGVNIIEVTPDSRLHDFMTDKQERVRARAKIIEDQENERQLAIKAQLEGDKERIQKQNVLLQNKDAARIKGEQEVLAAELQAKREVIVQEKEAQLAIINKRKKLQEAEANKGIQEASYEAAKFEAQAIKETGLAEAEVTKAKYDAINPSILAQEVDKAKALALYSSNISVQMPTIMQVGGSASSSDSISDMSSLKLLEMLSTKK